MYTSPLATLLFYSVLQLVPSASPSKAAAAQQPQRAVFDAPKEPEDIYANPPSILSTLQDQLQSDINDPALRCACAAGSLIL
jgi:hypothetical protein